MISNHKIQAMIAEMKDISKTDIIVYTDKGKLVASTFEPEMDMEEIVVNF